MSLPRMSWHIGDYKKDTGHLRAAQHGAYFMLCMHYWATGGLPDDDKQLATIACMTDREWKAARPIIEPLFKGEGKWKHKRVEEELVEAQEKYEKLSKAGRDGNEKRWRSKKGSGGDPPAIPNAVAMGSQPITDNLEGSVPRGTGAAAPPDAKADYFRRGREILGGSAGGLLSKLLRSFGNEDDPRSIAKARARIEDASIKTKPVEWLGRVMAGPQPTLMADGKPFPDGII